MNAGICAEPGALDRGPTKVTSNSFAHASRSLKTRTLSPRSSGDRTTPATKSSFFFPVVIAALLANLRFAQFDHRQGDESGDVQYFADENTHQCTNDAKVQNAEITH